MGNQAETIPKLPIYPRALNSYRKTADKAKNYLKKDGFICVEVGNEQSRKVKKIFEVKKFTTVDVLEDLFNIERVIIFKNKI